MAEEDVPMTTTEAPAVPEETKAETSTSAAAAAAAETAPVAVGAEDAELQKKAVAQIEFYFGDANLPFDK
ncbi:hypothetical protein C0993_006949 [Termitomyces sp. T159_Od127]|nr:hypothetical protein C0993_006949 [Termitomyces sp. T159_Od127]